MRNQDLVPPIIANAVIGDLLMMKEYIADDYYSTDEVDKYGPFVAVMTRDEYRKIEELIPTIEKDSYEYKDIVGIDDNGYITKLLYLFNNGESGIIIYVLSYFNKCKQKFAGKTFMTRGVKEKISNAELGYSDFMLENTKQGADGDLRSTLVLRTSNDASVRKDNLYLSLNNKVYRIFGENNKPSGSYTGNGDATTRTINIGGISQILYLRSPGISCIVSKDGAHYWQNVGLNGYIKNSEIKFLDGILTIATTHNAGNMNGVSFLYYCI